MKKSQQKKKIFSDSTYLSQVRQLRVLANEVIVRYSLRIDHIEFIQHGENATFKLRTSSGQNYLLRIHRGGYHCEEAILEELRWLSDLAKDKSLIVQVPILSKNGFLIEKITTENFPESRYCCVFKWIDGRHIRKQLQLEQMFQLGQLIARLQSNQPKKMQHRNYWLSEGLVGVSPKFGTIDKVEGVNKSKQKILNRGRLEAYKALKNFEMKHPERCGFIHADLHFGNLLSIGGRLAPIDFDDCGLGFFAYDLAVAIMSIQSKLQAKRRKEIPLFRATLIEGYSSLASWTQSDELILNHLLVARELMGVSWLNSRSDNPRLKKHLGPVVQRAVTQIKQQYGF